MQAIITKYHGPTDRRGSRVSATAAAGRVYLAWDDALNSEQNHAAAAHALAAKMEWTGPRYGRLVSGVLPDGSTAHVFTE